MAKIDISKYDVVMNEKDRQFEIHIGEHVAKVTYGTKEDVMAFFHTEVPAALGGNGLATKLAVYVLNYAKDNGYRILAFCPFIAKYISEHPEWHQYEKKLS